jgi:protein tyrosine phosphatase
LSPKKEESDEPSPWAKCSPEEVANRNRYGNVDPFLGNRVKLQVPGGHSDYINASPITLESTKSGKVTKFIATQVRTMKRSYEDFAHNCIGTQSRYNLSYMAYDLA